MKKKKFTLIERALSPVIVDTLKINPKYVSNFTLNFRDWIPSSNFLRGTISVLKGNKNITYSFSIILDGDTPVSFLDVKDVVSLAKQKKPTMGFTIPVDADEAKTE